MEALIARLLEDFERGKMNRRQLIQSLALAAVAAPAAAAAQAPAAAPAATAKWKTVWLDHISFQCTDYKRSVDFYTSLMGWKVRPGSDNGRQATLDIGDIGGIIIRNGGGGGRGQANAAGREGAPASGREGSAGTAGGAAPAAQAGGGTGGRSGQPRPPVNAVIDHISFGIEPWDNDTVRGELERRGLNPRVDTGGGGDIATSRFKSFHVKDPDGWDLQISNQNREHHEG